MVFNGNADDQDIFTLIDDYVQTDDVQFPLKQKARSCNKVMKTIWTWIFDAYGGWQFDDSNQTDLPVATATLTADQVDYALPSTAIAVRGIEFKDQGGVWNRLKAVTEEQIMDIQAESDFYNTSGTPTYYRLIGDTVRLYPASNFTQASSFRVHFERGISTIASTVTDTEPGFASPFHEAVAVGAALDFAKVNRQDLVSFLLAEWRDYEIRIKKFYAKRYEQLFPARITVIDGVRRSR